MSEQQTVWITKTIHRKMKTLASKSGRKLQEVVEEALEAYLSAKREGQRPLR